MEVHTYYRKHGPQLVDDYLNRVPKAHNLFEYDYQSDLDWELRSKWLDSGNPFCADKGDVVKALLSFNNKVNNDSEAIRSIHSLLDEQALVIVGGQQAGLFTGPMYVIHKAITIIQAAKKAATQLNRPVVPIFWIAGEDHDMDEVNHTYVLSQQLHVQKIKLSHSQEKRTSVSRTGINSEEWAAALIQLEETLPNTEFKQDLLDKLTSFSENSSNMVDHFAYILAWLFGPYGLVLMDSDDVNIRKLEGRMFRRLIEKLEPLADAFIDGRNKVIASGYDPQVDIQIDSANLFIYHKEQRMLLSKYGEGYSDKKAEYFFSYSDLLDISDRTPHYLSNNVLTRPLMQEYLFPVLGTVLGPGEIAYWALTRTAFSILGMKMPIVIPRQEMTLLEGTVNKQMQKFELSFEDVVERFDECKATWLESQDSIRLRDRFTDVKEQFRALYNPLLEVIGGLNQGMKKLGETNESKIMEQMDYLQARAIDAYQLQFDAALRQMERIKLSIMPLGKPQERVYNIIPYLNKYGTSWLQELTETSLNIDGTHKIVYL